MPFWSKKESAGGGGKDDGKSATNGVDKVKLKATMERKIYLVSVPHSHLNRGLIESNMSVPGNQEHNANALIKSLEMSPHWICP